MNNIKRVIRRYPLSTLLVIAIWVLCLIPVPETPLSDINMIDKWTHFVMYGALCSVIWMERGTHRLWHGVLLITLGTWLMGGLIELAQAYLTNGTRSGEWFDFVADGIGSLLGQPIGILLAKSLAKWRKAP